MRYEVKKSEIVQSVGALKRLSNLMSKLTEFSFDTETNTLRVSGDNSKFKLVGISISWGAYHNYYIPTGHTFETKQLSIQTVVKYLKPVFERTDVTIVGQNLKFDMHVLARVGINIKTPRLFDTMIASWICDENMPKGLKENSQRILGIQQEHFGDTLATVTKEEKLSVGLKATQKATFDLVSIENGAPYALDDAYYTWELYIHFLEELEKEEMEKIYYATYPQLLTTVFRMEERGITVDVPKLEQMGKDMTNDLEDLEYELLELAGIQLNLGSGQQLAKILFGYVANPKHPNTSKTWGNNPKEKQEKQLLEYNKKIKLAEKEREEVSKIAFNFPVSITTPTGIPKVDGNILKALSKKDYSTKRKKEGVEFCKLLIQYKKLSKLKSAFVDGLLEQLYEDGKAHPSFSICGTDSGRLSCSQPNLNVA